MNTSVHKIKRLSVRNEFNTTQEPERLDAFCCFVGFFFCENRFFWETTCVNHDNLSFIFQEKFLFILPYAKFMVHLPGAIYLTPMYVFRTWLIHDM